MTIVNSKDGLPVLEERTLISNISSWIRCSKHGQNYTVSQKTSHFLYSISSRNI